MSKPDELAPLFQTVFRFPMPDGPRETAILTGSGRLGIVGGPLKNARTAAEGIQLDYTHRKPCGRDGYVLLNFLLGQSPTPTLRDPSLWGLFTAGSKVLSTFNLMAPFPLGLQFLPLDSPFPGEIVQPESTRYDTAYRLSEEGKVGLLMTWTGPCYPAISTACVGNSDDHHLAGPFARGLDYLVRARVFLPPQRDTTYFLSHPLSLPWEEMEV